SYNTSVHEAIEYTPHELIFAKTARAPISDILREDMNNESYTHYLETLYYVICPLAPGYCMDNKGAESYQKGRTFRNRSKIAIENLNIFLYVNSKFIYVEKHIKTQLTQLYRDIVEHHFKPVEVLLPPIIQPLIKPKWHYISTTTLATSGIYNNDDIDRPRSHIMFPLEKPSMLNTLARTELGGPKGHSAEAAATAPQVRTREGSESAVVVAEVEMAPTSERALSGSERNESKAGDAGAPHKRNRSGAQKRRAKRDREKALEGQAPYPLTALTKPVEGDTGLTGKKRRAGSDQTPPSVKRTVKKPRAQATGTFATMADPLARAVVLEGYSEKGITPEQLTLFREVILAEMEGIQEGPLSRFMGLATIKNGAVIIRREDAASLGARLRVVGLDELQRRHRAVIWVPGPPRAAAAVLVLLERQNSDIGALNWRVFAENVGTSPERRNYVFGILESSARKLRERDSKLCCGIEQVTVKVARSHSGERDKEEPRSKD
ncbi:hypothetical protein ALC60_08496, partial [Trachymyrmex zeteki]